ncbi:MAG: hypothetical protein ACREIQ_07000, partial [Nitrospiria bacterium]
MQEVNEWLRLPDDEALEAGEDCTKEEPGISERPSWVPPRIEPNPPQADQARSKSRYPRPCGSDSCGDGPVTEYPAEARGQFIWEVFESPDERLIERDPESSLGSLRDGFHVEELMEEAEERAERFLKAQGQLLSAFFARRKDSLYRQAATASVAKPEQPEP